MAGVILEHVSRTYPGPVAALDGVDLEIRDRELLVLVGPSGSGKSTLLRLVAGLEQPTQGDIRIGGRNMRGVPPRDRDVALVFQSYALYPHLDVARNLAMPLDLRNGTNWWQPWLRHGRWKKQRAETDLCVLETARRLGIAGLLHRRPAELSGGQRQRVALGRALLRRPAVYLLDEPLSNVEARLRATLREELRQLQRELKATMVYVTHDQEEALTLGDRVAVLSDGRLQQVGPAEELVDGPRNRVVAGLMGVPERNFVTGRLEAGEGRARFVAGSWSVPLDKMVASRVQRYFAQSVVLGVRAEGVIVAPRGDATGGVPARVTESHPLVGTTVVRVECDAGAADEVTEVLLVSRTSARARMAAGDLVSMHLDMRQANVFDPRTGENIDWPRVVEGN